MDHKSLIASLPPEQKSRLTALSNRAGLLHLAGHLGLIAALGTAMAITGDIFLEGSEQEKTLTTANGTEIGLSFVEDRSSGWNLSDNEVWPGAVFAVDEDPGELENGNTLCGEDAATYVVFTPIEDSAGPFLQMAVFSGAAPENIESAGLCGTLNYEAE